MLQTAGELFSSAIYSPVGTLKQKVRPRDKDNASCQKSCNGCKKGVWFTEGFATKDLQGPERYSLNWQIRDKIIQRYQHIQDILRAGHYGMSQKHYPDIY